MSLLAIGISITVPLLLAIGTDDSSSRRDIVLTVVASVAIAAVASLILLATYHLVTIWLPRLLRRLAVWVTFKTIRKFVSEIEPTVEPLGITTVDDDVGVGLPLGLRDGVIKGEKFVVLNTASEEKRGALEVLDVWEISCICSVFDRRNEEFWNNLERKMRQDPSFPRGATVRREIPNELLFDWLQALLKCKGD